MKGFGGGRGGFPCEQPKNKGTDIQEKSTRFQAGKEESEIKVI